MDMQLPLDNGKYVITVKDNTITATRHGEPWRDLTGDNIMFFLLTHIADLECCIGELSSPKYEDELNTVGWKLAELLAEKGTLTGHQFNHLKGMLQECIEMYGTLIKDKHIKDKL